jgi:hypothetical protein
MSSGEARIQTRARRGDLDAELLVNGCPLWLL